PPGGPPGKGAPLALGALIKPPVPPPLGAVGGCSRFPPCNSPQQRGNNMHHPS
ncbi:unnamed protein product, partial [Amoebophrya sp. A25]